jgi:type II secretory ATPase GspE/PulE/Tfp pilus assembly ATPase PilB-like protein
VTLTEELRVPRELEGRFPLAVGDAATDDRAAIHAVDEIFDAAIRAGASDVHVEPFGEGGRVRERVDGMLREARAISPRLLPRVLSRIKLLAGMDIADRRLPQDGRYTIERSGETIDARVSSMPTIDGEKLAIRLLDGRQQLPSIEALGMNDAMSERFRRVVHAPTGFVVVCGPTGSGKTTTLYASMCERNIGGHQLCSIEDPVEIRLPGVAQVQVNLRAGLTFASGLRAFLRQDPNVVMIGEMRDAETATVATSAALCGQLVLTTLHSNDALCALERLVELGLSPRGVAASVTAIVSQRLVRRLCVRCKRDGVAGISAQAFGIAPGSAVAEAAGCTACDGGGYRGRRGIFEIVEMSPDLRHAVESASPPATVRDAAERFGYAPIALDAGRLISAGECSVAEAVRVLGFR